MRLVGILSAVVAICVSSAALAQGWGEYVNREDFFEINLPSDPVTASMPYRSAKGTALTAHTYTARAPADSILAGQYSVTVVDYTNAKDEIGTADDYAANAIKAKGSVKYDGVNQIDLHVSRRLTVETQTTRILAEILVAANNRLYITQAETPLTSAVPANFQASLQILDAAGARIRTRTVLGVEPSEVPAISAGGILDESDKLAAAVSGAWRNAGGTCEAAYFKAGARLKTSRNENALAGTVTNSGATISGQLIINGSREGQFIDPMTNQAIMLFDLSGDKLRIASIAGVALGWPTVTLELCPGSRA